LCQHPEWKIQKVPDLTSSSFYKNGNSGPLLFHRMNQQGEVHGISRKSAPINVIVHYPKTEEGKRELAQRVAGVHADFVGQYVQQLNCPSNQKAELLNAVIASAKKNR
jgi:hypothetical protein